MKLKGKEPVVHVNTDLDADSGAEGDVDMDVNPDANVNEKNDDNAEIDMLPHCHVPHYAALTTCLLRIWFNYVVQTVFKNMERSLYLINPYSDTAHHVKLCFLQKMLELGANDADEPEFVAKIKSDHDWVCPVLSLMDTHMSQLWSYFKEAAAAKVNAHFRLKNLDKDACAACVKDLMQGKRFIYPGDISRRIDANKPFLHPTIADVLSTVMFQTRCNFLIAAGPLFFEDMYKGKPVRMMPVQLLAMAATAVYSALENICRPRRKPLEFSQKNYSRIHGALWKIITNIEARKSGVLALILKQVYDAARNGEMYVYDEDEDDDIQYLDIDGMEVL
ncbi:uncharacterized protein PHACADRAFT_23636 [Phanerochaete carnosa HHB-10118-sp]|uniref:DUF6532 domain-containing protein n=1 Tax=Phanerochaete carnosa (strain HHB-10118-sp) TaxID=650164 RepID=K5W8C6_PHACS|nr:uncharacterized protein PHACADRAFT_23636 [Phanerochaete carnosa HHB-10118-sp]EKM60208.1 hypothetical protein PHACADRAFT_23636 [Phanerochaete carnosa HHB-10118-sp]